MFARFSICTLLLLISNLGMAIEFSHYSCDYYRVTNIGENWSPGFLGESTHFTNLGWNESTIISKSLVRGEKMGELGTCSYVYATAPENIHLNIYWIDGKNLNLEGHACMYSGDSVKFKKENFEVTSNKMYFSSKRKVKLNDDEYEFLHIVGIRPSPEGDVIELCQKAFQEVTGNESIQKKYSNEFNVKYFNVPGTIFLREFE